MNVNLYVNIKSDYLRYLVLEHRSLALNFLYERKKHAPPPQDLGYATDYEYLYPIQINCDFYSKQ